MASEETKGMVRDFLRDYRHPNAINGQDWTEGDVDRIAHAAENPPLSDGYPAGFPSDRFVEAYYRQADG